MYPLLSVDKIELIVKDREKAILQETTFDVYPGEFVMILGHNGSGKSSLLKILSGDRLPTSGKVLIDQSPLNTFTKDKKAQEFITITQRLEDRLFLELTIRENIILWESRFPKSKRLSTDQILKTNKIGERFLNILDQKLSTISGGEKQALLMSLALAHPPKILCLDEHTSALDHKASDLIMYEMASIILEKKITTIMITHQLDLALNYGSRLIILKEGKIFFDIGKTSDLNIEALKQMVE
jgi:putative ABC transport system ATP-binding protein